MNLSSHLQFKVRNSTNSHITHNSDLINIKKGYQPDEYWLEFFENMWIKPLLIDTRNNIHTNLLYVSKDTIGPRHYHIGAAHGLVIKGFYGFIDEGREQDIVGNGSYMYEPAGILHQPFFRMCKNDGVYLSYFTMYGGIVQLDENNQPVRFTDALSQLDRFKQHYKEKGLPITELEKIVK